MNKKKGMNKIHVTIVAICYGYGEFDTYSFVL